MSNTSATGGYLTGTETPLPGALTLVEFIHELLAGVTGINNTLVRPNWQENPPKQPDIATNWLAYGIRVNNRPVNTYVGTIEDEDLQPVTTQEAQENIQVECSFYGPLAYDNACNLRAGLTISQNLEVLRDANMGFKDTSDIINGPDLVNERWIQRQIITVTLVRYDQRLYPILSFASASGVIHTDNDLEIPWEVPEEA